MSQPDERASELRDLCFPSAQRILELLEEQAMDLENKPPNEQVVRGIRRALRGLKRESAAAGFPELASLAEELEQVLAAGGPTAGSAALPELVLSAVDMFDAMLAARRAKLEPPNPEPLRVLMRKLAQPAACLGETSCQPHFDWDEYDQLCMAEAAGRGDSVYNIAVSLAPHSAIRAAGIQLLKKVLQEAGEVLTISPHDSGALVTGCIQVALASRHSIEQLKQRLALPGVVSDVFIKPYRPDFTPSGKRDHGLGASR